MFDNYEHAKELLWLDMIGAIAGIGQLLASSERLTLRLVVGRALSSGVLAMAAGAVLLWVPDVPPIALYGLAAGLASLGTSGLERLVRRYLPTTSKGEQQ